MIIQSKTEYESQTFSNLYHLGEEFEEVEFTDCTFKSCDFSESKFSNCLFEDCTFDSTNLSNCKLNDSKIINSKFNSSKLLGVDFSLLNTNMGVRVSFNLSDLSYCSFYGLRIPFTKFLGCKMNSVDFSHANVMESDFTNSELKDAVFFRTNMEKCDFRGAKDYAFVMSENNCKDSIHSYNNAISLLNAYGIRVE